jgi:hypothetical protein
MKNLLSVIYGSGAILIIAGAMMNIFWNMYFGKSLIFLTIIFISMFQGWIIRKLFKKTENN